MHRDTTGELLGCSWGDIGVTAGGQLWDCAASTGGFRGLLGDYRILLGSRDNVWSVTTLGIAGQNSDHLLQVKLQQNCWRNGGFRLSESGDYRDTSWGLQMGLLQGYFNIMRDNTLGYQCEITGLLSLGTKWVQWSFRARQLVGKLQGFFTGSSAWTSGEFQNWDYWGYYRANTGVLVLQVSGQGATVMLGY